VNQQNEPIDVELLDDPAPYIASVSKKNVETTPSVARVQPIVSVSIQPSTTTHITASIKPFKEAGILSLLLLQ